MEGLPDGARLWAFGAGRPLEGRDAALLEERMPPFLTEWTAHRQELQAAWDLREDRFLLVAVDETRTAASGCSIDALMRHLRRLEEALETSLLDSAPVWYRRPDGEVVSCARTEFRRRAAGGEVGEDTPVFDLTLSTLEEVRAGLLERPARATWHADLLPRGTSASTGPSVS